MELVKVVEQKIGGELVQTVDARDLHAFLEIGKDFSSWVKVQIARARLVRDRDYLLTQKGEQLPSGTKFKNEVNLTLEAAKHIAMLSNTDKGFEVREYFIECEKRLKESPKPQTTLEIIAAQTQVLIQQEREIAQLKDRVVRVEAKQQAFEEGFKYFTVLGYAAYKGITVALSDAQTIGKQAAKLSRERNVPIDKVADQRFGRVNSYHESILDEIIASTL